MLKPLALFMLGGAANGKSSVVRALFCTDENPEDVDLPELKSERWCGPDREKAAIRMFTNAPGDAEAVERFGTTAVAEPKLGGAGGPTNRAQFERYPDEVRKQAEDVVHALNQLSVSAFANWWLAKQNPDGDGDNFGAGLTHEISKALAHAKLMRCLDESDPRRPFVWDAIGNPDKYIPWIERARDRGYEIRIIYVRCPLPVAQMWAVRRSRSISPTLVYESYLQAIDAAKIIEEFARAEGLDFEQYDPSEPADLERALELGYSAADPTAGREEKVEGSGTEPSIKP